MKRDSFGSRFGALVALAGSAVGLGNLWRFPYLVGENGGAAFIIIYVLLCFIICLPIFISEFVVGRRAQENAFSAFRDLSGGSAWRYVGLMTVVVPLIVVSYYSVIGGWSVEYLFKSVTFSFTAGESQSQINTMFADFVSSPWAPLISHTIFLLATAVVVAAGIKGGIEKFSKVMMPLLFVIVLGIAIYSMTLPGARAGLDYLFNPDFSKIDAKACAAALGQAFFSLSIGFGTIMTYASYVSKKENVMFQSVATAVSDLSFALIAGMAIMPAVFAFGLNPQSVLALCSRLCHMYSHRCRLVVWWRFFSLSPCLLLPLLLLFQCSKLVLHIWLRKRRFPAWLPARFFLESAGCSEPSVLCLSDLFLMSIFSEEQYLISLIICRRMSL